LNAEIDALLIKPIGSGYLSLKSLHAYKNTFPSLNGRVVATKSNSVAMAPKKILMYAGFFSKAKTDKTVQKLPSLA
jgi:hypothetical protein